MSTATKSKPKKKSAGKAAGRKTRLRASDGLCRAWVKGKRNGPRCTKKRNHRGEHDPKANKS